MPGIDVVGLRQQRAAKLDGAEAIIAKSVSENRDLNDAETQAYDELIAEAEGMQKTIERAEAVTRLKADAVKLVSIGASGATVGDLKSQIRVQPQVADPRTKGSSLVHMVKAYAAAKGNLRDAADYCEKVLGDEMVAKALAAGVGSAGGFLVPEEYVAEIIEFLRPASVVMSMGPMTVPMPGGNLILPKLAGGSSASYIGENTNLPTTAPQFGQLRLTARKLAALVPISNDLLRFATPSADAVVRDDLVRAIAQRQDLAFIRDLGVSNAPRGLRYWAPAANVTAANGTINLQNVTDDLGTLVLFLKNNNVRMINPGWLMSHRSEEYLMNVRDSLGNFAFRPEMLTGKLRTWPYKATTQIPNNLGGGSDSEVYLADFADVVIGDVGTLRLDASTEAAYYDGSQVQAAFSLDQTVIRAIAEHDLGMRHDFSVGVLTGVEWNP